MPEYPPLRLEFLNPERTALFYDLVNEQEVKKFFQEFNDDEEVIAAKLEGINDFPEVQEYWAIMEREDISL